MRRLPIAAQNLNRFDIVPFQIAMRIAGHRDRNIGADQLADFLKNVKMCIRDRFSLYLIDRKHRPLNLLEGN